MAAHVRPCYCCLYPCDTSAIPPPPAHSVYQMRDKDPGQMSTLIPNKDRQMCVVLWVDTYSGEDNPKVNPDSSEENSVQGGGCDIVLKHILSEQIIVVQFVTQIPVV